MILLAVLVLFLITLFYVTQEGMGPKSETSEETSEDTVLNKNAIHVDPEKNSVEIPNRVSGIVSDDLELAGSLSLLDTHRIEFGKGTDKGPASGTIHYNNGLLNLIGAGKDGEKSKIKLWDDVEVGSLLHVGDALTVAGPLKVNELDLGPLDKPANTGKVQYGDMLEITGAGNPRKIKLSDDVEVSGNLKTLQHTGVDQVLTGEQTVNKHTVTGSQTVEQQRVRSGQEVSGVSNYKGKVNINPIETDRRNMVDLSIGDELTGFRKGDKTITFTANKEEVGGFDNSFGKGSLFLNKQKPLEFGKGIEKHKDAGTIRYNDFGNGLHIVGAGTNNYERKIKLWDNVEVQGALTVNGPINTGNDQNVKTINASDSIKIGNWHIYEDNNQRLRFSRVGINKGDVTATRQDGIALTPDGDIWMTRDTWAGWVTMGIQRGDQLLPQKQWTKTELFNLANRR